MKNNFIGFTFFRRKPILLVLSLFVFLFLSCRTPNDQEELQPELTMTPSPEPQLSQVVEPFVQTPKLPTDTPTANPSGPFQTLMQLANAPQGQLQDEWLADNGDLWVTSDKGLYRYHSLQWQTVLEHNAGHILGADQKGRIWVLLDNNNTIASVVDQKTTLYGINEGWQPLLQNTPYLRGFGNGLVTDSKGQVWVATGQDDLRRYDPLKDRWEKFTSVQIGLKPAVEFNMETNLITDVILAKDVLVSVLRLPSMKLVIASIILRYPLVAVAFVVGWRLTPPRGGVEGNQAGDHDPHKERAGHRLQHGQHPRDIRHGGDIAVSHSHQGCKTGVCSKICGWF